MSDKLKRALKKQRYVFKKVEHMRRLGLINAGSNGIGKHGGACPDWLFERQQKLR